jgi:molecular chaperone GrpE
VNDSTREPVDRPDDGVTAPSGATGGPVPADGEQAAAPPTAGAPPAEDVLLEGDAAAGDDAAVDAALAGDDAPEDAVTADADVLDIEALADSDPRSKAELLAELLVAEAKRDEYLDDLRRSHADFENYRRRVMRDGAVQRAAGKAEVAGALLEVLDDLDRTLAAAEGSPDQDLHTGIRLVAAKLVDALRQLGLQRIDEADVRFDPEVHEAVQQQPGEGIDGEPRVVTVLRPGYRMDDRVLRAAMVAVEG